MKRFRRKVEPVVFLSLRQRASREIAASGFALLAMTEEPAGTGLPRARCALAMTKHGGPMKGIGLYGGSTVAAGCQGFPKRRKN